MIASTRALLAAASILVATAASAGGPVLDVTKTSGCGCCAAWIEHMEEAGFDTTAEDTLPGVMARMKIKLGVRPEMASCHTATIDGYVIEGHVPARDVARLLQERPDAIGLAVPGMPLGSPGMDFGDRKDAYEVMLMKKDGSAEVFSRYPGD